MKKIIVMLSIMMAVSAYAVYAEEKKPVNIEPAVSMEQAISIAKKEVPGKVIWSILTGDQYTVRITPADGGTSVTLKIDGNTGTIVRDEAPRNRYDYTRDKQYKNEDRTDRSGFTKPKSGGGFKKGFGDGKGESEGEEHDDDDD